jgi:hypothetical protein
MLLQRGFGTRVLRYTATVLMAFVVAFSAVAVRSAPARADGSSCEGILPYTCLYVFGQGNRVNRLEATHAHAGLQHCNYSAAFAIYKRNGTRMWYGKRSFAGCSFVRPWVKINNPNKNTGPGGYVCARWYENGTQHGGRVCKRLG